MRLWGAEKAGRRGRSWHPELNYDSPRTFSTKQRLKLFVAPPLIAWPMKCLEWTTRSEVKNPEVWEGAGAGKTPIIMAIWHETIALGVWEQRYSGFHALTSYSFDGELAARVIGHYGIPSLRGSSSMGGAEALRDLKKALEIPVTVGFTPDGPRGPRREAKAGIAILSARTGVPVIPYALVATPTWRLKTWDRFMIPKPFGRILSAYGEPIPPPPDCSRESIEQMRLRVQDSLNAVHARLEEEVGGDASRSAAQT